MKKDIRADVMVDIETLGNESDSTIIQISAIVFDIHSGKINKVFNQIADITKNKDMRVTGNTLKWWIDTDKDLLSTLLRKGEHSSDDTLKMFHDWLSDLIEEYGRKNVYLWGNGILFDNKMIQHQFGLLDLDYPIFYRNDRDVRTILELASIKSDMSEDDIRKMYEVEGTIKHNAIDDVKFQIRLVVGCFEGLIL